MPAIKISEFPLHRHDGGFFSSTCLHSQIPYDVGWSWWRFLTSGMPMLYLFEAFSWWWLGGFWKMLYHLSRILPWCQQHSSISLDFCWHQLHFLPIWCSIMTFRYAFTVSIIFIFGFLIQHHPLERNQAPIYSLPVWGGADMWEGKRCTLGVGRQTRRGAPMDAPKNFCISRITHGWTVTHITHTWRKKQKKS